MFRLTNQVSVDLKKTTKSKKSSKTKTKKEQFLDVEQYLEEKPQVAKVMRITKHNILQDMEVNS
ncbi:MAG TPA: hypothetical protein VJ799_05765 [Nitrososphaeraceae archaeon]|nr:hypothetical protein [Nitrososphaeraceae archaeon]